MLKRSSAVRSHQGKWAGVSGSIEAQSPLAQAVKEIHEETGLGEDVVRLLQSGEPLSVVDPDHNVEWTVHPFLFEVSDPSDLRLDWEHTESRWVDPAELAKLDTVPKLPETYARLWKR